MKKVLFVSYYYPPLGGVGAQRSLRFIKYLPVYDWEPYVLTADPSPFLPADEVPSDILPEDRVVRAEVMEPLHWISRFSLSTLSKTAQALPRLNSGELNLRALKEEYRELPISWKSRIRSWLFLPDDRIGWLPDATREGVALTRKIPFDCIVSTSAPYTAHLVAWRLARRTSIPWVADFRDLWSTNTFLYFPTPAHQRLNAFLEKVVVEGADRILTCTPLFKEDFLQRYSHMPPDRFAMITNGFDPADYPLPHPDPYPRFTISYVGDFYGPQTPIFFLLGLKKFLDLNPKAKENTQVLFAGPFESRVKPLVEGLGLENEVRFLGFLPHEHSVAVMRRSHVLLLVLGEKQGGEKIYPAKLFEYLAAQKPILALVPDGLTKDLLKESGVGFVVQPSSEDSVATALEKLYQAHSDGSLFSVIEPATLPFFDAKKLTRDLVHVLEGTLESRKAARIFMERRK
jgi:glycosyltransferase involved in cell wall biosynthesis